MAAGTEGLGVAAGELDIIEADDASAAIEVAKVEHRFPIIERLAEIGCLVRSGLADLIDSPARDGLVGNPSGDQGRRNGADSGRGTDRAHAFFVHRGSSSKL
jgi:hypothetical protein